VRERLRLSETERETQTDTHTETRSAGVAGYLDNFQVFRGGGGGWRCDGLSGEPEREGGDCLGGRKQYARAGGGEKGGRKGGRGGGKGDAMFLSLLDGPFSTEEWVGGLCECVEVCVCGCVCGCVCVCVGGVDVSGCVCVV
jgi:hypothetical protein